MSSSGSQGLFSTFCENKISSKKQLDGQMHNLMMHQVYLWSRHVWSLNIEDLRYITRRHKGLFYVFTLHFLSELSWECFGHLICTSLTCIQTQLCSLLYSSYTHLDLKFNFTLCLLPQVKYINIKQNIQRNKLNVPLKCTDEFASVVSYLWEHYKSPGKQGSSEFFFS